MRAAIDAWEWALVDGVYSNFARLALMARPGQPCNDDELAVLDALRERAVAAGEIVLAHAVPAKESDRLVEELTKRKAAAVAAAKASSPAPR